MNFPGTRHYRIAIVTLAMVLSAVLARVATAYSLEGPKWPAGATVTFQNALGNAGRTLADGNTSWVAAAPFDSIWNGSIHLSLVSSANVSAPISRGDHVNSISWGASAFGQSFGSGTLAITFYSYSGSNMTEADIVCNTKQSWDSYRGNLRFGSNGYAIADLRRVLLHEVGHAIGLNHPDQAGQHVSAVMNSVISDVETTVADDVAGGRAMYGSAQATPTPTPTPSPTPTATPTPTPTPSPTATPPIGTIPVMTVSASPTSVRSGGTATFTITASAANPDSATTVFYAMTGTAVRNSQYSLSGTYGSVTIPAGATTGTVTLTVVTGPKKAKTATMNLSSSSGYSLGTPRSATVSVRK